MTTKLRKNLIAAVAAVALPALAVVGAATAKSTGSTLTGAGSSFVFPLVSTWTPALDQAFGYTVNYGPIGSGGGIAAISSRTVDFGASDAPLTPDQAAACKGCVQIPWALSATSVAYNVPGAPTHLKLNGKALAAIFLGKIDHWNDAAIKKLNVGADLPNLKITPVYRSDASGTTYNFTDYLSSVSGDWKSKVGNSTQVSFPAGVGAKGSSGVSGVVSRTEGAVTYVDVAYALKNHIRFAAVQNRAGKYLYPSLRRIAAAGATVTKVPSSNEMHIADPPKSAANAYPISTFTYVILPLETAKAKELRKLVFWTLTQGQTPQYTAKLLFSPVPKPVIVAAERTLKRVHS